MKLKFNMIGLFVKDLDTMVAFYEKAMGLKTNWDKISPYAEFDHQEIRFAMYKRKELPSLLGQTPSFTNGLNGTFELAINVGKPSNVDKNFNHILKSGAKAVYEPRNEPWKMRSAMVSDPEGNLIEIASDFWE